jgi:two-component system phosphate regulon sensor histidine kinase PhoR
MRRRFFWFALVLAVVEFLAISAVLMAVVGNDLGNRTVSQLLQTCRAVAATVDGLADDALIDRLKAAVKEGGYRATLIAPDGTVKYDSREPGLENHANRPEVASALGTGSGTAIRYSETLHTDVVYVAVRMDAGGKDVLRLSMPLSSVWDYRDRVLGGALWLVPVLLVLCAAAAWLLSGRINRPIREMTDVSKAIADGRYDLRIRSMISAHDDLGELSRSFNTMTDRVQSLVSDLHQENEKLNALLDAMSNGVMAVNRDMRVTLINARIMDMLGMKTDPTGTHVLEATRLESLEALIKRVMQTGETVTEEMRIGGTQSEPRPIQFHIVPMLNQGVVVGAVIRTEDLQALRALEQMRTDFAANVSHELKTPLTSIRGFVETLQHGAIDDKEGALRFLHIISVETERLNRLIEDILTLSNIESGHLPAFVPINLQVLAEETLEFVRATASDKHIALSCKNEAGVPVYVLGNTDWIKQMLINLADNAIKYTQAGGHVDVTIGVRGGVGTLRVSDNGIGIPRGDLQRIFERFYRVDKSRSRALGSTGLGLAIVKHIVARMGGSVEVESELGKGTVFTVRLPLAPRPNG